MTSWFQPFRCSQKGLRGRAERATVGSVGGAAACGVSFRLRGDYGFVSDPFR